ncbi:limbic system-associated membrane protein-like, partial [Argonauta hians]
KDIKSLKVTVQEEETLKLKCGDERLDKAKVFWKKGTVILSFGREVFKDSDRISILDDMSIKIVNVTLDDEANYECQLPKQDKQFFYNVTVTIPPTVKILRNAGPRIVMLSEPLSLDCVGTGKPDPKIIWQKNRGALPDHVEKDGNSLLIGSVIDEDAGEYECTADNGVGNPVNDVIQVSVHYEPTARIETDVIHSGPGHTLSIICMVEGSPTPDVSWFFNGNAITDFSGRTSRLSKVKNAKIQHELTIRPLNINDMGEYECLASNKYGQFNDAVNLTAIPKKVIITSDHISKFSEAYRISWTVWSATQLVSNKILLRMINFTEPKEWQEINVPVEKTKYNGRGQKYDLRFDVTGLTAETTYEAMIQAENDYGYGEFSDVLIFETPKYDNNTLSAPPTTSKPEVPEKTDAPMNHQHQTSNGFGLLRSVSFSLLGFFCVFLTTGFTL